MPGRMPEDMPDRMPEDMPYKMPDRMSDRMPVGMPDKVPECLPEDLPDRMPDRMSEDMQEDMPGRVPGDMPVRLATSQTKKKTQWLACKGSGWYLGDFHHEDMTEDMLEDLPVTKRINVMVGITRSKVIFHSYFRRQQLAATDACVSGLGQYFDKVVDVVGQRPTLT